MTLNAFIPSLRKPGKAKVAQIVKQLGFTEKGSNSQTWVFGKTRFRVDLVDFRDDMRAHDEEGWVDEVGWDYNWAVRVGVNHRNRSDENYILWHCLLVVVSEALGSREVWLDGGTGIPQQSYGLRELFPDMKSDEGEDVAAEIEVLESRESEPMPEQPMLEPELPMLEPELPTLEPEPEPVALELQSDDEEYGSWGAWEDEDEDEDDEDEDEDDEDDDEDDDQDDDEDNEGADDVEAAPVDDEGVDVITDW